MSDLREQFEKEMASISESTILSPAVQKKKLILYAIRTTIAVAIIYFLWDKYTWIKWAALAYVPLNLIGLFSIVGTPYLLNKKMERTRTKIASLDVRDDDE